ncbi:hypothetical protein Bca4012_019270 [Brassica carinata]
MGSVLNKRVPFSLLTVIIVMFSSCKADSKCEFKAIFNFGDSNSDTGGFWAAFPAQSGPWGMTYFKKPVGRASDLIIDFLAESLGMPFLSPYLQSIGSDFRYGANFATLASTVLLPNTSLFVSGISPFSLAIQLNQMKQFKVRVDEFHSSGQPVLHILPPSNVFGKSLYTFYIGQNDFTSNLASIGVDGVKQYLPQVIGQIAGTIKVIFNLLVGYVKGMKHGIKACCGYGGRPYNFSQKLFCGTTKVIGNSSVTAKACRDPQNYVSWDGIHATEAANRHILTAILDGSISYPPFVLNHICPSV